MVEMLLSVWQFCGKVTDTTCGALKRPCIKRKIYLKGL